MKVLKNHQYKGTFRARGSSHNDYAGGDVATLCRLGILEPLASKKKEPEGKYIKLGDLVGDASTGEEKPKSKVVVTRKKISKK